MNFQRMSNPVHSYYDANPFQRLIYNTHRMLIRVFLTCTSVTVDGSSIDDLIYWTLS
jgi:hypothetical protein